MVFWIDPDTGICMKGIYYYNALDGSVYTKTILCAQIETENILLPEYKQLWHSKIAAQEGENS